MHVITAHNPHNKQITAFNKSTHDNKSLVDVDDEDRVEMEFVLDVLLTVVEMEPVDTDCKFVDDKTEVWTSVGLDDGFGEVDDAKIVGCKVMAAEGIVGLVLGEIDGCLLGTCVGDTVGK